MQQNSFTAQYGWSTGNVINVVTKVWRQQSPRRRVRLHAQWDARRQQLLQQSEQAQRRPNSHRNQFGVALGGPVYIPGIYKQTNKTFFFFNYEGHRETQRRAASGTVPIPAFRNGDFSALLGAQVGTDALCRPIFAGQLYDPFTTRQVTAELRSRSHPGQQLVYIVIHPGHGRAKLINSIGADAYQLLSDAAQQCIGEQLELLPALQADYSDEYSGRIDHNFSDRTRLYGRYS